ncbi:MAG TPA: hypothetical protein VKT78_01310 [Fimbriimonadaceae bacterium]|nr:hypothetical protein [Fimbriimonadaceae bacterium]
MSVEAGVIHRQAAPSGPVNAYSTDVTLSTDPSYPGSQVPRTNTDIQIPVTPPQGWDSAKFTVVGAFESPMEGADSMGAFVRVEPAYVNGQFILNARAAGATPGHSRFRLVYLYTVNR